MKCSLKLNLNMLLTAGNAKNEIPSSAQNDAITFPCHVSGTISPYPTERKCVWKCYHENKLKKQHNHTHVISTCSLGENLPVHKVIYIAFPLWILMSISLLKQMRNYQKQKAERDDNSIVQKLNFFSASKWLHIPHAIHSCWIVVN